MIASLSHMSGVGPFCIAPKSSSSHLNHKTSYIVFVITLYSTSAEDLDTIVCFFALHETSEPLKLMNYHVHDLLVVGLLNQLTSQYIVRS